jgi:predicted ATP-grasp superfamily ATP-dependent carboligase
VNLAITTSSSQLSEQLKGYVRGSLDVPAGIHTVLDVEANQVGLPAVGLWAQVPHYLAAMPYPAASLALLEGLHAISGLSADTGRLPSEARASRARIDDLVNDNPDHQRMVAQLEEVVDSDPDVVNDISPQVEFGELPSGDELAAELQKFLRDRPGED